MFSLRFRTTDRLSDEEAVEFSRRLTGMIRDGLPLASGMEAIAAETTGKPSRVAAELARSMRSGESLQDSLHRIGRLVPESLRVLLSLKLSVDQFVEVVDEYIRCERRRRAQSELIRRNLAYPMFLLGTSLLLAVFHTAYRLPTADGAEFEIAGAEPPFSHDGLLTVERLLYAVLGISLLLVQARRILGWFDSLRSVDAAPSIRSKGSIRTWNRLSRFYAVLSLLMKFGVPTPRATRIAGRSTADARLASAAEAAASRMEAGYSTIDALPPALAGDVAKPLLTLTTTVESPAPCFALASRLFELRAEQRAEIVRKLGPALIFCVVAYVILVLIASSFFPLMGMLNALGGSGGGPHLHSTAATLLVPAFVFALLVLPWVGVKSFRDVQRSRRTTFAAILQIGVERRLPLWPLVLAYAEACHGWRRRRLAALAELLRRGESLATSIDRVSGLVDAPTSTAIHLAERSMDLASALHGARRRAEQRRGMTDDLWNRLVYFTVVLLISSLLIWLLSVWVQPKLKLIIEESGVSSALWLTSPGAAAAVGSSLLIGGLAAGSVVGMTLVLAALRWFGVIPVGTDFLERLWFRADGEALLFDALADCAEQGRPLTETLGMLSERFPLAPLRRRLARANQSALAGRPVWESMRAAGLLRRNDLAVISAAQRVGNVPWALHELADACHRRQRRHLQYFLQLISPLAIFGLGAVIGYIAICCFEPLIRMIEALT